MNRLWTLAVVLITVPADAGAAAQTPDEKELAGYRLTMAAVRQVEAATEAMFGEFQKDPRYREHVKLTAEIEALAAKEDRTDAEEERLEQLQARLEALGWEEEAGEWFANAETLSEMEAGIRKKPLMTRALRSAGMSPREYAKFILTFLPAMITAGLKKEGMLTELPKGISPENLKFIEDHEPELTALQKKWDAMGGGTQPRGI